jgi:cysteinyl-tRNA synthetase
MIKFSILQKERRVAHKSEAWNPVDLEMHKFLLEKQRLVHESLLDNFNTPAVINHLIELVNKSNVYLQNNPERKGYLSSLFCSIQFHYLETVDSFFSFTHLFTH